MVTRKNKWSEDSLLPFLKLLGIPLYTGAIHSFADFKNFMARNYPTWCVKNGNDGKLDRMIKSVEDNDDLPHWQFYELLGMILRALLK